MTTLEMPPEGTQEPLDVANLIRQVNASNEANKDLYLRTRQAADVAGRRPGRRAGRHRGCDSQVRPPDHPVRAPATPGIAAPAALLRSAGGDLGRSGLLLCRTGAGRKPGHHDRVDRLVPGRPGRRRDSTRLLPGPAASRLAHSGGYPRRVRRGAGCPAVLVPRYRRSQRPDPSRIGRCPVHRRDSGFLLVGYRALRLAETPQTCRARRRARIAAQAAQEPAPTRTGTRVTGNGSSTLTSSRSGGRSSSCYRRAAIRGEAVRRHLLGEETPVKDGTREAALPGSRCRHTRGQPHQLRPLPASKAAAAHMLTPPPARSSVLIVITDQARRRR